MPNQTTWRHAIATAANPIESELEKPHQNLSL
ncbi:hypothetical protein V6Z12_D08G080800 [Gossypium hirsutum]